MLVVASATTSTVSLEMKLRIVLFIFSCSFFGNFSFHVIELNPSMSSKMPLSGHLLLEAVLEKQKEEGQQGQAKSNLVQQKRPGVDWRGGGRRRGWGSLHPGRQKIFVGWLARLVRWRFQRLVPRQRPLDLGVHYRVIDRRRRSCLHSAAGSEKMLQQLSVLWPCLFFGNNLLSINNGDPINHNFNCKKPLVQARSPNKNWPRVSVRRRSHWLSLAERGYFVSLAEVPAAWRRWELNMASCKIHEKSSITVGFPMVLNSFFWVWVLSIHI